MPVSAVLNRYIAFLAAWLSLCSSFPIQLFSSEIGHSAPSYANSELPLVAIGAISQSKAIKKAEVLQDQIQEVNTADWYLCGKDLSVYTRLEEIYVPMDRMILRSGRAVQVTQIGEKWVEIKSQGKIGYILRSDFDEYFSEISLNIG